MKPPEDRRPFGPEPEAGGSDPVPGEGAIPRPGPKPYRRPRLVTYGRLAEITRFGGSQVVDSGGGDLGEEL